MKVLQPGRPFSSAASGLWAIAAAIVISGCAASASSTIEPPTREVAPVSSSQIGSALRTQVADWKGTPYVLGGTSRSGLDCSAFVRFIYNDIFGIRLPRATEQQVRQGQSVRRSGLQAGDLVFFRPSGKTRHVGIYLGDDEFAHVSTSSGVMISNLHESYWSRRYWTARRVISGQRAGVEDRQAGGERSAERTQPERPSGMRSGW